ncbi:3-hydroxyacyl-CoA dehydrogenase NAD-binding domain-containing protein [Actinomadura hibisca]|uniref:3-hydroxyacyl-CoA dehydrogenase NAD-binding domain-containing protein n=1 Tax=Actinomadura hibisca TaxID=68565 RepID=UPI000834A3AD|nr:3-hydroxyacyl-CoA dehydrogenase NAD-binding domain-containing protein [Actinomadura hibisca]
MTVRHEESDGIVTLTFDAPGREVNTLDARFRAAFAEAVGLLEADRERLRGVVLTSAKKTFAAGADLTEVIGITRDDLDRLDSLEEFRGALRRLERLGRPVAAALTGSALGGGLEIALACHRRFCGTDPAIRLGLPEAMLGVLPGAGGLVRTVRLLGLQEALPLLLQGTALRPEQALAKGIADELADDPVAAARAWIASGPEAVQPWDRPGHQIPGGTPGPDNYQLLAVVPAMLQKETHGAFPAQRRIQAAAVESLAVDFDTALRIELEYFVELLTGQTAKNMIGTLWFQLNALNGGASRPDVPPSPTRRLGVLGAGMMGAGIAYVAARAGIDVVLKDVSAEAAERGRDRYRALLDRRVEKGRMTPEERTGILDRIRPTGDAADLAGCDLVVEAVFEDRDLKNAVLAEAAAAVGPGAVLASNTSTLPITSLAEAVPDQSRFVGTHFFSPVDQMPALEIVRGERTAPEAVAKAVDLARALGKTPLVVGDGRGFFTTRVFTAYVLEAAMLVGEGVPAALIENLARQAGMRVGPLAVLDEVGLDLALRAKAATEADLGETGVTEPARRAFAVIDHLATGSGRTGRAGGAGFYDYPTTGPKRLWPALAEHFGRADHGVDHADVRDRLMFTQALETVRALEDGVLTDVATGNVGTIMGLGFAPQTGGALQFINAQGLPTFTTRARELADAYGERFLPPRLLCDKEAVGESF